MRAKAGQSLVQVERRVLTGEGGEDGGIICTELCWASLKGMLNTATPPTQPSSRPVLPPITVQAKSNATLQACYEAQRGSPAVGES